MSSDNTIHLSHGDILVVDDNTSNLKFLTEILTEAGHRVRPATDGELALMSAHAKPPELILLDIRMPGMSGIEVCHRLRAEQETKDIPIIFLSALTETEMKVKALKEGGTDYVTKPIEPSEVLARIETHLHRYRLQQKLAAQSSELIKEIEERKRNEAELTKYREQLEEQVNERTLKLKEQKEQLQAITENVPGVVFQFYASNTGETGVHYISPKLFDIFGLEFIDDPSLFLQTFVENIHEEDRQSWIDTFQEVAIKQIPWRWNGRYVKPSGEIVWFEGQSTPTIRKNEIVFDGIFIDITEKIEQEKQKLKSNLQKEQLKKLESLKTMAGAIAHRFNNAMMAVLGNLDLMKSTLSADSKEYQMVSDAAQAARGASHVGSMMLSYVGQQPFKLQDVALEKLVRECVAAFKSQLQSSISLQFIPPDQPLYCSIDQRQIKEVIESILANAIEALGDGTGTIKITFGTDYFTTDSFPVAFQNDSIKDDIYTFCQIKDTGHGIEPHNLARIFEPFFTTRFVGRGLGLALTVGIMRSHHGALLVESSPDIGTTVRVLLPSTSLSQQTPSYNADDEHSETVQLSGDILLADDEEVVLDVGRKMLEMLGFTVHTAINGLEAVEKIRNKSIAFCAVVLDISMPEMDGIEAMDEIKKVQAELPIILSSGYTQDDLPLKRDNDKQPDGFLQKPFQLAELKDCLEKLFS